MLLEKINGSFEIYIYFNNKIVSPHNFEKWILYLKNNRNLSSSSILRYSRAVESFITWSLYSPRIESESLVDYLSRYRHDYLLNGKKININYEYSNEKIKFNHIHTIFKKNISSIQTINLEVFAITSYLTYLRDIEAISESLLSSDVDWLYYKKRKQYGQHSGYGLQLRGSLKELIGKKKSILKPLKYNEFQNSKFKDFPFYFFDELLELSTPQEKLIYLLCGACAARMGQALNFTWYDIDYNKKEIYLVDPKSYLKTNILNIPRYKFLKDEFNIDSKNDKPHNSIGFKYPIPLDSGPLWFLLDYYKNIFFSTLKKLKPIPKYLVKHPFVFVTSTRNRLTCSQVDRKFKQHLSILKNKYPLDVNSEHYDELEKLHNVKGIHSLRHMFAVSVADIGISIPEIGIDVARVILQNLLGHKSESSTRIYFNIANLAKNKVQNIINNIKNKTTEHDTIDEIIEYYMIKNNRRR